MSDDITLAVTPLTERVAASVTPPVERVRITVTPPGASPVTLSSAAPPPPIRLTLTQSIPRISLTVGPQIGRPGPQGPQGPAAGARSNPVFTNSNGRLALIGYADGSTKAFAYDAAGRLASVADTTAGVTRTRTFHYDQDNNLASIT